MKRILITGANSYIGTSFETYMQQFGDDYQIDTIDLKDGSWKEKDFSGYDSIIHLAAIVHVKEKNEELYYQVNRDLAVETAKKAKDEGVSQFIFFSSMSIFGVDTGVISKETMPQPKTPYGKSKLAAEKLLGELDSPKFKVCILRPPMIYGPNTVGNYPRLARLAKKSPIFPKVKNQRSMLYINNLALFLKLMVDSQLSGTFHPQNKEYVNTSDMVEKIAEINNKKIRIIPGLDGLIQFLSKQINVFNKVFGTLVYDREMKGYPGSIIQKFQLSYQDKNFEKSIKATEASEKIIN
ncbi:NAD-dependent epimerase/dehydratase family protein [Enterococcus sp. JM9B]|uniref:NAD-dependent epimerase/dehydratase family protein n=1 Tax=Enterococcus sp. JM9B TaxID=1857216 RepID=UPI001374A372|nr:NAD-dependent epimerase/dehydratase family protein [Enterococcus sp. JM9B]KAF1303527.1 NAD-dependent epimerase [Enterococcus sp. JM9B]